MITRVASYKGRWMLHTSVDSPSDGPSSCLGLVILVFIKQLFCHVFRHQRGFWVLLVLVHQLLGILVLGQRLVHDQIHLGIQLLAIRTDDK